MKRNTVASALVILAYEASMTAAGVMWWLLFMPAVRGIPEGTGGLFDALVIGTAGVWLLYTYMAAVNRRFFGARNKMEAMV